MKVSEILSSAQDAMTVRRVFGEPYERDGVMIVPAASVAGGAGAGTGTDEQGNEGNGAGFGVSARPAGAYVVKNGTVRWRPAIDVNRLVSVVGAVVIAYLVTRARVQRARARRG